MSVASMSQSRLLLLTGSVQESIPYLSSLALASENGFDIEAIATDAIRITGQLKSVADALSQSTKLLYAPAGSSQ
jgi:hypothetical protein